MSVVRYAASALLPASVARVLAKYLLPVLLTLLAKSLLVPWIAQRLLNASSLRLEALTMSDPKRSSVSVSLDAVLAQTGPLATCIRFKRPVQIMYKGRRMADSVMSDALSVPPNGGKVHMRTEMLVHDVKHFGAFTTDLVQSRVPVRFVMNATGIEVSLLNGLLRIPGLRLVKEVELQGMSGLQDMAITAIEMADSTPNSLIVAATCRITNTSTTALSVGTTQMVMALPGSTQSLALITIPNTQLQPGENILEARCEMPRPVPAMTIYRELMTVLSNYVNGEATDVLMAGHPTDATPYDYLLSSFASLRVKTSMPGLGQKLLHGAAINLSQLNPLTLTIPSYITVANPFPLPMTIMRMVGTATTAAPPSLQMGTLNASTPIYVKSNSVLESDIGIPMKLSLGVGQLLEVARSRGELVVNIDCQIDCRLGECFISALPYSQRGVTVTIRL
ncbi:hypothetical protein RI367_002074 [Sorochytrium milnesiophthora]